MEQSEESVSKSACGGSLTDPGVYPITDHDGIRVYFCTRACLRAFEENPDGFMNEEVGHLKEDN